MPRLPFLAGGASIAMAAAGALLAAGIALWEFAAPAPPAQAAMSHGATPQGAHDAGALKAAAPATLVMISNFTFGPAKLTVPVGTRVVWTNRDSDPHVVRSETEPKLLDSPPLDTGESFSFTFDKPGTYRYFCAIHPHMQGVITVQ